MFAHFLIPQMTALPNMEKCVPVKLTSGKNVIGRNTFGITDKRVSREQIEVLVDIDKKSVTIIQKGLNPCTLTQPNGKKKTTTKDQPFELFDNDSFGLIGDEFVCKLEIEKLLDASTSITKEDDSTATTATNTSLKPVVEGVSIAASKAETTPTTTATAATSATTATTKTNDDLLSEQAVLIANQIETDGLLAMLLQEEFDEEASRMKSLAVGGKSHVEQVADKVRQNIAEAESSSSTAPTSTTSTTTTGAAGRGGGRGGGGRGGGRGTKRPREFGLIETRDGRRRTARPHARVDYREENFMIQDSDDDDDDDDAEASIIADLAPLDDASSEDDWRPNARDADDDDDDLTGTTGGGGGTAEIETVDGLPVCRYGKDCYRKNEDHRKQFWHPQKETALSTTEKAPSITKE